MTIWNNYFKTALRNIVRYKLYSLINLIGLALGIACFILIFTILSEERAFNNYNEHADRIYRINKCYTMKGETSINLSTPYPLRDAVKEKFPEVQASTHISPLRANISYGDQSFRERDLWLVSPSVFDVFSFEFLAGDAAEVLSDLNSIAISESMTRKYFGTDDPIGKVLILDNEDQLTVKAVYRDTPVLSDYRFNFLINLNRVCIEEDFDNWYDHWMETFVLVRKDTDINELEGKIDSLMKANLEEQSGARLQNLRDIHLYSVEGNPTVQKYVYIFGSIAILILLVACINFMNLATAQAVKRAREVGIRKLVGARKRALILQFVGEAIVYAAIAGFLALLVVELFLPLLERVMERSIEIRSISLRNVVSFLTLLILVGMLSGIYPAVILSSYSPVKVLKTSLGGNRKKAGLRTLIVVVQFTLAVTLLIGTGIIYSQLRFMENKDLGFDQENLIYMRLNSSLNDRFEYFAQSCEQIPGIISVSRTSSLPNMVWNIMRGITWEGNPSEEGSAFSFLSTDRNIVRTLDLKLIMGRDFLSDLISDENAVIINREAVKMMGVEDPVGITLGDDEMEIIGVIEDFNSLPLNFGIEPLFITLIHDYYYYILIKMSGTDMEKTISDLEEIWMEFNPEFPFKFDFIDSTFDRLYRTEIKAGILFRIFAGLGILIACLGLFGLASYMVEQKQREIGIRKVMGSNSTGIVWMFIRQFLPWILLANVIAWPLTTYFMTKWLAGFEYQTSINPLIYLAAGLLTLTIAFLSIGVRTIKVAGMNPADVLKYE